MCDRKGTPRITGLSRPIVHIDGAVWYIAVGSSYPGRAQAAKGVGVHALKGIVSWVKNVKNANAKLIPDQTFEFRTYLENKYRILSKYGVACVRTHEK